jgi:hypothetical protein
MQRGSDVSAPVRLHHDLNILIERHQETQKALNRKLPEFTAQHLGDVGLFDAEKIGSLNLFQAASFHDRFDFKNELRLHQVPFGIRLADVFEHVPASAFVSPLPHSSCSFAIRSAAPSRRLINQSPGAAFPVRSSTSSERREGHTPGRYISHGIHGAIRGCGIASALRDVQRIADAILHGFRELAQIVTADPTQITGLGDWSFFI